MIDGDLRFCLLLVHRNLVDRRVFASLVETVGLGDPSRLRQEIERLAPARTDELEALAAEHASPETEQALAALLAGVTNADSSASSPTMVEPVVTREQPVATLESGESWTVTAECPGRYRFPGDSREAAEIGRGGIGRVLVARDSHLGRDVALKELLTPEALATTMTSANGRVELSGTPATLARFLREAKVTGQLEHPGIVPIYELGARPDGTLYYTMKLVRGRTLAQALATCRTLDERLRLLPHFVNLCHAVAYAHSRNVIHRDIKPANVMLGEFGETVLLDWGLARVQGGVDIHDAELCRRAELRRDAMAGLTVEGVAVGTPQYMSPEQVTGNNESLDARTDVWALGVVLYQILTGTLPFAGTSPVEVMRQVLNQVIMPPHQQLKSAPRELSSICLRALSRHPDARYASARELVEDVEAYRDDRPVLAHAYTIWERGQRFATRNRAALIAALTVMAVVVAALVVVTASWRSERTARQREAQARATERAQRLEASFRLAQGYGERAARLTREGALLDARVFAAASWLANPVAEGGEAATELLARRPEAADAILAARSRYFQASAEAIASLRFASERGSALLAAAASPDGQQVATGASDGRITLWETTDGHVALRLQTAGEVRDLAFSPDGRRLAATTSGGLVECWELSTEVKTWSRQADDAQTHAVAFAPDDASLMTGGHDGVIRVWAASDGQPRGELGRHAGPIHDLAVASARGRTLVASASRDQTVRVWDLNRRRLLNTLRGATSVVRGVAFGDGGRLVAAVSHDKTARVWELPSGRSILVAEGFEDELLAAALSSDGRRLIAGGWDGRVTIWDVEAAVPLLALNHQAPVWAVSLGEDGRALGAVTEDGRLWMWELSDAHPVLAVPERSFVWFLDLSADGRWAATAATDGAVRLYDRASGQLTRVLRGHRDIVGSVAFSPDSQVLASSGFDGTVRLWDPRTGRQTARLAGHQGFVRAVAWSPDGTVLASAGSDQTVRLWDTSTGRERTRLEAPPMVRAVTFDAAGSQFAAASESPSVVRWEFPSGKPLPPLSVAGGPLAGLAYSPGGETLAAGSEVGLIILFDTAEGKERLRRQVHRGFVYTLRFSSDGKWLASAGDDRKIVVQRADDLTPVLVLEASQSVMAIDFSDDGRVLAMGDGHLVRLVALDLSRLQGGPAELLAQAERAAGLRLEGFDLRPR